MTVNIRKQHFVAICKRIREKKDVVCIYFESRTEYYMDF